MVVLGNDPHINGRETVDRASLALPPEQEALLRAVLDANPSTVLVAGVQLPVRDRLGAGARARDPVDQPRRAGDSATRWPTCCSARRTRPGGCRRPGTARTPNCPARPTTTSSAHGWTYQYPAASPLYPFGHGLSYTTFTYGPLQVTAAASGCIAGVTVTNTGDHDGDEVVQLFVTPECWPVPAPVRRLVGFERVPLAVGESREVRFDVPVTALAYWSGDRFVAPPGEYLFRAGPAVRCRVTRHD